MSRFFSLRILRRLPFFLLFLFLFLGGLFPLCYGVLNFGNLLLLPVSLLGMLGTCLFSRWSALCHRLWRSSLGGKIFLSLLGGILAAGLLTCGILSVFMARAAHKSPPEEPLPVLVLGGQITGDQPAPILRNRLEVALAYLQAYPTAPCIVTGGQGSDEAYSEAYVMKLWLTQQGISADRIYLEPRAGNTAENLTFSAQLLAQYGLGDRVVIATDSWHQLRAQFWANSLNLEAYAISCPTPWIYSVTFPVREMLALLRFILLHY